jgi:3-phytase
VTFVFPNARTILTLLSLLAATQSHTMQLLIVDVQANEDLISSSSGCFTADEAADEGKPPAVHSGNSHQRILTATPTVRLLNPEARDQDDLCIWYNATAPEQSTVITSDKTANRLFVYDLTGRLLQSVAVPKPGNIDIRSNVKLGQKAVSLVVVNQRAAGFRLCAFRVDPMTRLLTRVDRGDLLTGPNYGCCLHQSADGDHLYCIVTSEDADIEQYELTDDGGGHIAASLVRTWNMGKCEGIVADDSAGMLYVAEETRGVWRLPAAADATTEGTLIAEVGTNGIVGDVEGITLTRASESDKTLIFSDQGSSTFHVMPLKDGNTSRRFQLTGVSHTDGCDVLLRPLGPAFPNGLFACHSDEPRCPIYLTPAEQILE